MFVLFNRPKRSMVSTKQPMLKGMVMVLLNPFKDAAMAKDADKVPLQVCVVETLEI